MRCEHLVQLINRSNVQYQCLLVEATELLRNFDTCGIDGYERSVTRRHEAIADIQKIDADLADYLERVGVRLGKDDSEALAELRTLKETATKKILELDALVIALAGGRLNSIKDELANLKVAKIAGCSYEKSGRIRRRFNSTA